MPYDPDHHHRRSIRLESYDYTQDGAYFVTICTYQRECIFGDIVDGEMQINNLGQVVQEEWLRTGERANVELDIFIVMPNHVHGVLFLITDDEPHSPQSAYAHPITGSLGTIVGAFKSAAARRINQLRDTPGAPVWQRNYFEHVIRDQAGYEYITRYVQHNAAIWAYDRLHPESDERR